VAHKATLLLGTCEIVRASGGDDDDDDETVPSLSNGEVEREAICKAVLEE
jgi:hypothetical protein